MRTIQPALIGLAMLGACGSGQTAEPTAVVTATASNDNEPPVAATGGYEVHEWGLASGALGGAPLQLLGLPPPPAPPMSTRAPILYIRLLGDSTVTFTASVHVPNGSVTEHWPAAERIEGGVRWRDVRAERNGCSGTYPAAGGPECAAAGDGQCESARLRDLEAADAACLTIGGQTYNHLFYRGNAGSPSMPLEFQPGPGGTISVTNRGGASVGELLRVVRGPGQTLVTVTPIPGPGQRATLPPPTSAADLERARQSIGAGLRELGMSGPETQAFERAWLSELFDPTTGPARETRRGPARDMSNSEAILYWLPEASAAELATLSFEPAPRAVRRAFLVRLAISP